MSDPFVGEIRMVGFNYAPEHWALCDGQLLPVNQYTTLFSLFGDRYGGDGRTTFGVPDLRGRGPIHQGRGPGLTPRILGQMVGYERVSLTSSQVPTPPVPPHTHELRVSSSAAGEGNPSEHFLAQSRDEDIYATSENAKMNDQAISQPVSQVDGGGGGNVQPHENMSPGLVLNFIVALDGYYPPRP